MPANIIRKRLYWVTLFFITLSGFAQMPIFKRYYIADIPGLGWLAQFYVTHFIHYLCAIVLIALIFYALADVLFTRTSLKRITRSGYIKIMLLLGLILSGGLLAFKNLSGVYWSHGLIIFLDLFHLVMTMLLLAVSFYALIKKKKWMK